MSSPLSLSRFFLLHRSCFKETVACLTTAASVNQSSNTAPQLRKVSMEGRLIDNDNSRSSLSCMPSFASFDAMLSLIGGTGDAVYKRLAERSIEAYNAEKGTVDAELLPVLKQNRLVVFLEGTVDSPKSLMSMNVVKMLTHLQSLPLVAIDVTAHPGILGFALTQGKKSRCPFLFVDGICIGSHDNLVQLYQSGVLAKQIAGKLPPASPCFAGELPIALY